MKYKLFYSLTLVIFGLLFLTNGVEGAYPCSRTSGTGHTERNNEGRFVGTADVLLDGQNYAASVETTVLGAPKVTEDGTLHLNTAHTIVFPGGSITTHDYAVLSPSDQAGVYSLNTRAEIIGGTGVFAGAGGFISFHGTVDLINGLADWRFNGRVCG